jgi:hypothetical protein
MGLIISWPSLKPESFCIQIRFNEDTLKAKAGGKQFQRDQ